MENLIGTLSISTAGDVAEDKQQLVDEINRVAQPPQPVTVDTVYLGVLLAASNQVNLQGGCFEAAELSQLTQLIVDAPVMVGHQKQNLPIGRVFRAEVITRDGIPWLQAHFYWHRDQRDADALKTGIDSGIYRECSLGFLYGKPECCVCREDMRHCRHRPNEIVRLAGRDVRAFYYYKQIAKVLEVSLVYRGAVPNTRVTTLAAGTSGGIDPFWRSQAAVAFDINQIKTPLAEVLIEPLYHGIWLDIDNIDGKLIARTPDGNEYRHPLLDELSHRTGATDFRVVAQLVSCKGSSRLPVATLKEHASSSGRHHCRLFISDLLRLDGVDLASTPLLERKATLARRFTRSHTIAPIPSHRCLFVDLQRQAFGKGSGEGLRIIDLSEQPQNQLFEIRHKQQLRGRVEIETSGNGNRTSFVTFAGGSEASRFRLIGAHALNTGDVVLVQPTPQCANRFNYLDTCIGETGIDSLAIAAALLAPETAASFRLLVDNTDTYWLELHRGSNPALFCIRGGNPAHICGMRRLLCESINLSRRVQRPRGKVALVDQGRITAYTESSTGRTTLTLAGTQLQGSFVIEAFHLGNRSVQLFGKTKRSE